MSYEKVFNGVVVLEDKVIDHGYIGVTDGKIAEISSEKLNVKEQVVLRNDEICVPTL